MVLKKCITLSNIKILNSTTAVNTDNNYKYFLRSESLTLKTEVKAAENSALPS